MYIYKWYVFVKHKYVWMTIFSQLLFWKGGIIFVFAWYLVMTTYEVEHPWCGKFLGILSSNFEIFLSEWLSPTND